MVNTPSGLDFLNRVVSTSVAGLKDKKDENGNGCRLCGDTSRYVSKILGICVECIRTGSNGAFDLIREAHGVARKGFNLPSQPPKSQSGLTCGVCSNRCRIGEGEKGYCGLKWNDGRLSSKISRSEGLLYAYLDPHITNCCSSWFCPGGTGAGYPRFTKTNGPEYGFYNLSIFMYGCNFDCLFCQNPSHKEFEGETTTSIESLVRLIKNNRKITCICFFGGSPEPQLPFTVEASKAALESVQDRVLRVCFEWNGCGNEALVQEAAELAFESGGNLKFDLKCFNPFLSLALSGVDNREAYRNFENIAKTYHTRRPSLPLLTATTLLVPGYVDAREVESIAKFISNLDPVIPYGLLVFHPAFMIRDLPVTPLVQVVECYKAAKKHLDRVHIGNLHLIGVNGMDDFEKIMDSKF